ncbi:hypothetical protein [Mesorhizobium sp. B2-6-5]|uniref:hypothetical protein n=1 Tax=Mesorhizobium sp. B2-6-5 TaxID=2589912 RepID=UPI0015E44074|nr:hypothetical protein [Mesorhizobium sp. B2-6-5]
MSDAQRAIHEQHRNRGRTDAMHRGAKQLQPTPEMHLAEAGYREMWWQGPPFISGRSQQCRGPEVAHLCQMTRPFVGLYPLVEYGAEKLIAANFIVKAVNHTMDHGLVKHIRQRDAVDDDRSLAPTIPAHNARSDFRKAKAALASSPGTIQPADGTGSLRVLSDCRCEWIASSAAPKVRILAAAFCDEDRWLAFSWCLGMDSNKHPN